MVQEPRDKRFAHLWVGIASIGEGVDPDCFELPGLNNIAESQQMVDVGMHPAVRKQTEKMKGIAFFLTAAEQGVEFGI